MRLVRKFILGGAAILGLLVVPITAASATPSPVNGHAVFFTSADAGSGPGPIIFTGRVLHAVCTDNQGENIDHIVCRGGTFDIDHTDAGNNGTFTFNPVTCVGVFTFSNGPFSFINGTGAYTGLSGSGLASGRSLEVSPRLPSGACNMADDAIPVAGFTSIHASFHASLS